MVINSHLIIFWLVIFIAILFIAIMVQNKPKVNYNEKLFYNNKPKRTAESNEYLSKLLLKDNRFLYYICKKFFKINYFECKQRCGYYIHNVVITSSIQNNYTMSVFTLLNNETVFLFSVENISFEKLNEIEEEYLSFNKE